MCKQYDNSRQNADLKNCVVKIVSWLLLQNVTFSISKLKMLCYLGNGVENVNQNQSNHIHSVEAFIQFLFNSLCCKSHSKFNSFFTGDSIHNNSWQLSHSMSILHNSIPFHLISKRFLTPEVYSFHVLEVPTFCS